MPLNAEQAFKVGFLMKCAEAGLTIEETRERVKEAILHVKRTIKTALDPIGGAIGLGTDALGWGAKQIPSLMSLGGAAAIGLPIAAGAGTGYLAAKLNSGNGGDMVDDAKQDEIVGEYERLAEEARRRARIKQIQEQTGRRILALTPSAAGT